MIDTQVGLDLGKGWVGAWRELVVARTIAERLRSSALRSSNHAWQR